MMMLMVEEQPQLSTSLLTRSTPTCWGKDHPLVVNQVEATAPLAGGQKRKRPPPTLKCKQSKPPADQVLTQIELPSYRRLRSPLDLDAIEIIFGQLFEVFRHASHAAGVGSSARGAT
jgi:hypothetical protein